jgi:glycosyltransferase involved in cell wall biosynthesis
MSNKNFPKVTIMIPTYNQELYIGDAIKSALAQDYENLEVIVSDDCSNDKTGEIALSFCSDKRLKYYRNEKNLGRVGNYHKTLYDYATGDWVVNLDGDDYYTDNHFISRFFNLCYSTDKNIVMGLSTPTAVDKAKQILSFEELPNEAILLNGQDYFFRINDIRGFNHMSMIYNRLKAKEIGFYISDSLISDFHSGMRLALNGYVILSPHKIGYWRVHGKNCTTQEISLRLQKNKAAFEDMANYAKSFFDETSIKKWLKKSFKSASNEYFNALCFVSSTYIDILKLLPYIKFKKTYFRNFLKAIIIIHRKK